METLVMQPENKEQLTALKAIARALKIPFKKAEFSEHEKAIQLYGADLVNKIESAKKSIAKGNVKVLDATKSLWENLQ